MIGPLIFAAALAAQACDPSAALSGQAGAKCRVGEAALAAGYEKSGEAFAPAKFRQAAKPGAQPAARNREEDRVGQALDAFEAGDYRVAEQIWLMLLAEAEAGENQSGSIHGRQYRVAQALLPQGRAPEAVVLLEQAMAGAQEAGDIAQLITILNTLAEAYFDLGRYADSAAILRPFYERSRGGARLTYANNLARALDGAGRYADAETLLLEVVAGARAEDGQLFSQPHALARNLFNLARNLAAQGRHSEAGELFAESAALTVERRPPGHTDIIAAHSFLARHKLLAESDGSGALEAARTLSANLNAYLGESTGGEIDRRQSIQNAGEPLDLFTLHVEAAWAVANGG